MININILIFYLIGDNTFRNYFYTIDIILFDILWRLEGEKKIEELLIEIS
jgi:hypothetical protein